MSWADSRLHKKMMKENNHPIFTRALPDRIKEEAD